ncbi:hypothetical protein PENSUB_2595, partial [Penicillium subrubescens]
PWVPKYHTVALGSDDIRKHAALLLAVDVEVEMGNVGDSVLIRHHPVKDSWLYLNAREVERLD